MFQNIMKKRFFINALLGLICTLASATEPKHTMQTDTVPDIEVYNAISPNNDNINDYFQIKGIENYPNNKVLVYSRWGNLVFEEISYQNTWDGNWNGKNLPDGTYFYVLEIKEEENLYRFTGTLTVYRGGGG